MLRFNSSRYAGLDFGIGDDDEDFSGQAPSLTTTKETEADRNRKKDRESGPFWDVPLSSLGTFLNRRKTLFKDYARSKALYDNLVSKQGIDEPIAPKEMPKILEARQRWEARAPRTGFLPLSRLRFTKENSSAERTEERPNPADFPNDGYFFSPAETKYVTQRMAADLAADAPDRIIHPDLAAFDHHPQQLCRGRGCTFKLIDTSPSIPVLRGEYSKLQDLRPNIGIVVSSYYRKPALVNYVPDEVMAEHERICGDHAPDKRCAQTRRVVGSKPSTEFVPEFETIPNPKPAPIVTYTDSTKDKWETDPDTGARKLVEKGPEITGPDPHHPQTIVVPKGSRPCNSCSGSGIGDIEKPAEPAVLREQKVLVTPGTPAVYAKCEGCKGAGLTRDPDTDKSVKCESCGGYGVDKNTVLQPAKSGVSQIRQVEVSPAKPAVRGKCDSCTGKGYISPAKPIGREQVVGTEPVYEDKPGECPFKHHMSFCDEDECVGDCPTAAQITESEVGQPELRLKVLLHKWDPHTKQYLPYDNGEASTQWDIGAHEVEHLDYRDSSYLNANGSHPFNFNLLSRLATSRDTYSKLMKDIRQDVTLGRRNVADKSLTQRANLLVRNPKPEETETDESRFGVD